jgi:Fur family ferric uptake transcriptional regulator
MREDQPDSSRKRTRNTHQREAVLQAIDSTETFKSAQDVYANLRSAGIPVGLTTVYRHLQILAKDGVLDALKSPSGEVVYRHCKSSEHHHHIVCNRCGQSAEIDGPEVEKWVEQTSQVLGYTDVSHTIEIFGICARCSQAGV